MIGRTVDERSVLRARERRGAATMRALSARPGAELRGHHLTVDGRAVPIATPYLVPPTGSADVPAARIRGIADGLGMMLKYTDLEVHGELRPEPVLARIVFDGLEQLRCDALVPEHLTGVRTNITAAFDGWTSDAIAAGVDENRSSMLVFTTLQMVRSRLSRTALAPQVDELTEVTRFHLGPVIGHALRVLPSLTDDQHAYAEAAAEIARLVAEIAQDASDESSVDRVDDAARHRLIVPPDWSADDSSPIVEGSGGPPGSSTDPVGLDLERVGDYEVFTGEFDRQVRGDELYPADRLRTTRHRLDELERAQAVSPPQLAARLLRLLGRWSDDDWSPGEEDGVLDGRRLGQVVASRSRTELFKRPRQRLTGDTVVGFLIDNSGSMKRQRHESIAVLVDTFSRALDLAGIANEVLGFTTAAWAGGRPIERWRRLGEPVAPGRMNERLHVVYKDADTSWRRSRRSIAALLRTDHYREGLDGEALAWAHDRLMRRPEPQRVLVLISDGSPTDAATASVNRAGYLEDHLAGVADRVERFHAATGRGVLLGAIGVDRDMERVVRRAVNADLSGTLDLRHYAALAALVTA